MENWRGVELFFWKYMRIIYGVYGILLGSFVYCERYLFRLFVVIVVRCV